MKIDRKKIPSLPEKERDLEIKKLLWPDTWEKYVKVKAMEFECIRVETTEELFMKTTYKLDWNLAKEKQGECDPEKFTAALWDIFRNLEKPEHEFYDIWIERYAQPHHLILAALIAKEEE